MTYEARGRFTRLVRIRREPEHVGKQAFYAYQACTIGHTSRLSRPQTTGHYDQRVIGGPGQHTYISPWYYCTYVESSVCCEIEPDFQETTEQKIPGTVPVDHLCYFT